MPAELAPKSGRPKNIMNDQNLNTVWVILQENQQMTYQKIAESTNILKISIVFYSTQWFTAPLCSRRFLHHFAKEQMEKKKDHLLPMLRMEIDASRWSKFPKN